MLSLAALLVASLVLGCPFAAQAGTYCSATQPFCVSGSTTAAGLADFRIVGPPKAKAGWIAIGMGADSMPGSEIFVVGRRCSFAARGNTERADPRGTRPVLVAGSHWAAQQDIELASVRWADLLGESDPDSC